MAINDLQTGSTIQVRLTRPPTNEAAAKTLSRIFGRAPEYKRKRTCRKRLTRDVIEFRRRGGRLWRVAPKAPRLAQPEPGAECNLLATTQLLRDLQSVNRFVEVNAK